MNDVYIAATSDTAEIDFKFSLNSLTVSGECFPENANEFFYPILVQLESYLNSVDNQHIEFNFRLTYFNSASTKMLYNIFDLLNKSACTKNRVSLNWFHDEDDDTILDFGFGVRDDYPAIEFESVAVGYAA